MGFIGVIGAIISLLRFLPDMIALVRAILDLINGLHAQQTVGFDRRRMLVKLRDALKDVRTRKDTTKLEELQKELNSYCVGDLCGSDNSVHPLKIT